MVITPVPLRGRWPSRFRDRRRAGPPDRGQRGFPRRYRRWPGHAPPAQASRWRRRRQCGSGRRATGWQARARQAPRLTGAPRRAARRGQHGHVSRWPRGPVGRRPIADRRGRARLPGRDEAGHPDVSLCSWADGVLLVFSLADEESFRLVHEYSRRFIHLVNTNTLAKIFRKNNLGAIFKHQLDPNSNKNSIYADALEALIGFVYTSKGLVFSKKLIMELWQDELDTLPQKDPKTFIQEYCQKKYKIIPIYKLIKEAGTKHKPKFLVSLKIKDNEVVAEGVSKQKAEILAAKKMIKIINKLSK
mgnify:CR=1 FL=1